MEQPLSSFRAGFRAWLADGLPDTLQEAALYGAVELVIKAARKITTSYDKYNALLLQRSGYSHVGSRGFSKLHTPDIFQIPALPTNGGSRNYWFHTPAISVNVMLHIVANGRIYKSYYNQSAGAWLVYGNSARFY